MILLHSLKENSMACCLKTTSNKRCKDISIFTPLLELTNLHRSLAFQAVDCSVSVPAVRH